MRRVIKVGGSLLTRPDLQPALGGWMEQQSVAENLVIVGGGELIDEVRRSDQIRPGDPAEVHWRCIDLLETTRNTVASQMDWNSVLTTDELSVRIEQGFSNDQPTLVAVKSFFDRDSQINVPLDWRTTSDTIAAILAIKVEAEELVLLKSCALDPSNDILSLAKRGIVDEAFPTIAGEILSVRVERLE
jgi:aspartokinase-like uncharacterized kinase